MKMTDRGRPARFTSPDAEESDTTHFHSTPSRTDAEA